MRRIVAGVAAVLGALVVPLAAPATVEAHAVLEQATPADGSMLDAPPDRVELVFSESVGRPASLIVVDQAGEEVAGSGVDLVDDTLARTFDPAAFEPGIYTVSYQVTSLDGHVISGSLSFMVHGTGESMAPPAPQPSDDPTDADPFVVVLLAVLLAAGLAASLVVVRRVIAAPDAPVSA